MLKLGTQTGSMMNHLYSRIASPEPVVGMGATILGWTDRHAATIVEVSANKKTIVIQQDTATRTDKNGMSESQDYTFTPNPNAARKVYTLRKNGKYHLKGDSIKGSTILIGERDEYYDFSF